MGTQSHISKVAANLIGKLKVRWEDAEDASLYRATFSHISPQKLYKLCADDVRKELRRMSPETLGRLALQGKPHEEENVPSLGKTTLYSVHCGSYLSKYASGREILLELVTTALIAEMTDQLEGRYQI